MDEQATKTDEECKCIDTIRAKLNKIHDQQVCMDLSMWLVTDKECMISKQGLPPLRYSYMEGKKKRKSYVSFAFCPFCGKKS